ncbi:hypothetical protein [Labrys neptuniae]
MLSLFGSKPIQPIGLSIFAFLGDSTKSQNALPDGRLGARGGRAPDIYEPPGHEKSINGDLRPKTPHFNGMIFASLWLME